MHLSDFNERRTTLNALMADTDSFFAQFGALDDAVYTSGAIDKKHKELMGLAISIATRCDECITYHIPGCIDARASLAEIIDAIKIGVIAGGSITYPNARHAFRILQEVGLL